MAGHFEWDPKKAAANAAKHGVIFEEAQSVFTDLRSITIFDPEHSHAEDRFVTLGLSIAGRLLVVVHTDTESSVRIISARIATKKEARNYAKG